MAAREDGLSARCISLLEEVKGLIENRGSSPNASNETGSNAGANSDAGTTNVSLPRSVSVMQDFRTLFAPYSQSSRNNSLRPPPAKKPKKPGYYQVKETWTHEFFCLASAKATHVPSRAEKIILQNAGLGRKKVVFSCKASALDAQKVLEGVYPKLHETGGFELLRSGSPCSVLALINPPAAGGYSVPFLRDAAGLGQALAYIKPLQRDLDTAPLQITEQVHIFG